MFEILFDRVIIELKGEKPLSFLQKLTTNDLLKNKSCYTYMLSNLGRYLFDFFVYNINGNCVLIDINASSAENLITKLNFYKLRAKIEIGVNDAYTACYSNIEIKKNVLISYRDPRFYKMGYRSIILKDNSYDVQGEYNLYSHDKYQFTIPDGYIDLEYDRSIPVEYGAEELHSIDYTKGCYVGQEVISRTKYQGVIRKKIFKVIAQEPLNLTSNRVEIISDNVKLGVCCSYYRNCGIALIREEKLNLIQNDLVTVENIPVKLVIPEWRQI